MKYKRYTGIILKLVIIGCLVTPVFSGGEPQNKTGEPKFFLYLSPYNIGPSLNFLQKDYIEDGTRPYFYLMQTELMKAAVVHPKLKLGIGVTYINQFLRLNEYVANAGAIAPLYFYYILSYRQKKQPLFNHIFMDPDAYLYKERILPLYVYFGVCFWQAELGEGGMKDVGICWSLLPFLDAVNLNLKIGYMYCDYFYEHTLYVTASFEFGNWYVIK